MKFNKLMVTFSFLPILVYGQCDMSEIADSYLLTDGPIVLSAGPDGGTFWGPGVTGGIFDPAEAGPGIHTIYYSMPESGTGNKYLVQSVAGNPWLYPHNQELMDLAFGGPSEWIYEEFETMDMETVFSSETGLVFLDGSNIMATGLSMFLSAHMLEIEEWVYNGGHLFLNSAPNEGADIPFGFGGTILEYEGFDGDLTFSTDVKIADMEHPQALGPFLPVVEYMNGTYFGHGLITGSDLYTLLTDATILDNVVVAEKIWGEGRVIFGGLVTHNFQAPETEALNWRANLLYYLYSDVCIKTITVGGYATVEENDIACELYPNPARNEVNFTLPPNTTIQLFTISGQVVTPLLSNVNHLNIGSFEPGMYLVVFTNENGVSTQKLTIN